jgi:hypothetical protein
LRAPAAVLAFEDHFEGRAARLAEFDDGARMDRFVGFGRPPVDGDEGVAEVFVHPLAGRLANESEVTPRNDGQVGWEHDVASCWIAAERNALDARIDRLFLAGQRAGAVPNGRHSIPLVFRLSVDALIWQGRGWQAGAEDAWTVLGLRHCQAPSRCIICAHARARRLGVHVFGPTPPRKAPPRGAALRHDRPPVTLRFCSRLTRVHGEAAL